MRAETDCQKQSGEYSASILQIDKTTLKMLHCNQLHRNDRSWKLGEISTQGRCCDSLILLEYATGE